MRMKKAYSMIELIVSIASLVLILGIFSVIVRTYLDEFERGVLSDRKWADVQTFFTYLETDIDQLSEGLSSGQTLEISKSGKIEKKDSNGNSESATYLFNSGKILRNGSVILRRNKDFDLSGMEIKVYKKEISGKIIENWDWKDPLTDDPVVILPEAGVNYYVEPVIKMGVGKEITSGHALRFDGIGEQTEDVLLAVEEINIREVDLYNYSKWSYIRISGDGSYSGKADKIVVKVQFETDIYKKLNGLWYWDRKLDWISMAEKTTDIEKSVVYESKEKIYVGKDMDFWFSFKNSKKLDWNKYVKITVEIYDSVQ